MAAIFLFQYFAIFEHDISKIANHNHSLFLKSASGSLLGCLHGKHLLLVKIGLKAFNFASLS